MYFPIWNQSIVSCPVLTVASWFAYVYQKTGKVVCYSHLFKNFPQFVVVHTIKDFSIVNKAEVEILLEFHCFLYDPANIGNLISDSSAFSKSSFYIYKFLVHRLLKPSVKDFEHYLASMWNECNCMVIGTLFGIALLWSWNENCPFSVLCPYLSFPNLLSIQYSFLTASSFRIWNCSAGIPPPPQLCS